MPQSLANTPAPPYYAVIFTSVRTSNDPAGYEATSQRMLELAADQPGYLGVESARGAEGLGITVSYWRDLASIRQWQQNAEHLIAQQQGRELWYRSFRLRVCRVERASEFGFDEV